MIYLKHDENDKVTLTHFKPFDAKRGLKKTRLELEKTGVLVDEIPVRPADEIGKVSILFVKPVRWEVVDRPLTKEEKLQALVDAGTITQEQMNDLLK